jgi:hypothetical protein
MDREKRQKEDNTEQHYDLTEDASKRSGGTTATTMARAAENDDVNEETNMGDVNGPGDDYEGENRVSTSLSED